MGYSVVNVDEIGPGGLRFDPETTGTPVAGADG
jgi:hypothetical protein